MNGSGQHVPGGTGEQRLLLHRKETAREENGCGKQKRLCFSACGGTILAKFGGSGIRGTDQKRHPGKERAVYGRGQRIYFPLG